MRNNLKASFFIEDNIPEFEGRMRGALSNVKRAFEETGRSGNMDPLNKSLEESHKLLQVLEEDIKDVGEATDFSNRKQSSEYSALLKKFQALKTEINGIETAQRRLATQSVQVGKDLSDAIGGSARTVKQQVKDLERELAVLGKRMQTTFSVGGHVDTNGFRKIEDAAKSTADAIRGHLTNVKNGTATVNKSPEDIARLKRELETLTRVLETAALKASEFDIKQQHRVATETKRLADKQAADAKRLSDKQIAEAKRTADKQIAEAKRVADRAVAEAKRAADRQIAEDDRIAKKRANLSDPTNPTNIAFHAQQRQSYLDVSQRISTAQGGGTRFKSVDEIRDAREQLLATRRYMPKDAAVAQALGYDDPVTAQLHMRKQAMWLKEEEAKMGDWEKMSKMQRIGAFLGGNRPGGAPSKGSAWKGMTQGVNQRITNVSQLMGTSLYGLGAAGAASALVTGTVSQAMEMEQTKTVLAGLINTYQRFNDVTGKAVSPQENFNRSLEKSGKLYEKIRKTAEESILTSRETTQYYMGAAAFGMRSGLKEDQVLRVSERMGTLGKAMGLADRDITQDIRALLQPGGKIGANEKTEQILGITKTERDKVLKEGPDAFMKWFEKKFAGLNPALDKFAGSFANRLAAFVEKLQASGRVIGGVLIEHLGPMLDSLKSSVDDWVSSGRAEKFAKGLGEMLTTVGGVFSKFIEFLANNVQSPLQLGLIAITLMFGRFIAELAVQKMAASGVVGGFIGVLAGLVLGIGIWMQKLKNDARTFEQTTGDVIASRGDKSAKHAQEQRSKADEYLRSTVTDAASLLSVRTDGGGDISTSVKAYRSMQSNVKQLTALANSTGSGKRWTEEEVFKQIFGANLGNTSEFENMSVAGKIGTSLNIGDALSKLGIVGTQDYLRESGDINPLHEKALPILNAITSNQAVLHQNQGALEIAAKYELGRGGKQLSKSKQTIHDQAIKEAKSIDPSFKAMSLSELAAIESVGRTGNGNLTPAQLKQYNTYNRAVKVVMAKWGEGTNIAPPTLDDKKPKAGPGYSLGSDVADTSGFELALSMAQINAANSQNFYGNMSERTSGQITSKMLAAKRVYDKEMAVIGKQFTLDQQQINPSTQFYLGGMRVASGEGAGSRTVLGGRYAGMNAEFANRLKEMIDASGGKIKIGSGARTLEQQQALFNQKGPHWAAKPSPHAPHVRGVAADLEGDLSWAHANASKYGLSFPLLGGSKNMGKEPWHIQLMSEFEGGTAKSPTDKLNDTYTNNVTKAKNKLAELIRKKDQNIKEATQKYQSEIIRLTGEYGQIDASMVAFGSSMGEMDANQALTMSSLGISGMDFVGKEKNIRGAHAQTVAGIENELRNAIRSDKDLQKEFKFYKTDKNGKVTFDSAAFESVVSEVKANPSMFAAGQKWASSLKSAGFERDRSLAQNGIDRGDWVRDQQAQRDARAHAGMMSSSTRDSDLYGRALGMRGMAGADLQQAKIEARISDIQEAIDLKRRNMDELDPNVSGYSDQIANYQQEIKTAQEQIQSQRDLAEQLKRNTSVTAMLTQVEASRLQQRIETGRYENNPFKNLLTGLNTQFATEYGKLSPTEIENNVQGLGFSTSTMTTDDLKDTLRTAWIKQKLPLIDAARGRSALWEAGGAAMSALLTKGGDPASAAGGIAGSWLTNRMQGNLEQFMGGKSSFRNAKGQFDRAAQNGAMAEFGTSFLVNQFLPQNSYAQEGSQFGGLIGSLLPAAGPYGAALGILGGGLLGSLFGKKQVDPADQAYRKRIEELLSRIDKNLRPVGDYYRTKVTGFNAATAYLSGRSLGFGESMGAH